MAKRQTKRIQRKSTRRHRRRQQSRSARQPKMMRGGSNSVDAPSSFGTMQGSFDFQNLMKTNLGANPAVYDQPTLKMFGSHNSPIV